MDASRKQNAAGQADLIEWERKLMNGEEADCVWLEAVPYETLRQSPVLLKAYGFQLLKQGKLPAARVALEEALKGLAQRTLQLQLLEAFSALATVLLRIGEVHEAETVLRFLKDHHDRGEEPSTGHVPLALARGAYLLGAGMEEQHCLAEAFELFRRSRQPAFCCEAVMDLALLPPSPELKDEFDGMLLYLKNSGQHAYCAYALTMQSFHEGNAQLTLQHAAEAATEAAQYDYYHEALLKMIRQTAAIQAGHPVDEAGMQQLRDSLRFGEADLHLQFFDAQMMFEYDLSRDRHPQAQERLDQAKAICRLCGDPLLMRAVDRMERKLSELAAALMESSKLWRVYLFGGLRFVRAGQEYSSFHWKRKKAQELLLYLLLQPEYRVPRDQALEALFGEGEPEQLAGRLYVTIHQLKQVLQDALHTTDAAVHVKDGYIRLKDRFIEYVDVEQYLALVRIGDQLWASDRQLALEMYEKAQPLYSELVPEAAYIEWLDGFREHLLEKHTGMLKRLGLAAAQQRNAELAETYYLEWIRLRPLQEEAYQAMILLCNEAGRRPEAAEWYTKWERICREELRAAPSPELKRLIGK